MPKISKYAGDDEDGANRVTYDGHLDVSPTEVDVPEWANAAVLLDEGAVAPEDQAAAERAAARPVDPEPVHVAPERQHEPVPVVADPRALDPHTDQHAGSPQPGTRRTRRNEEKA